MSSPRRFVTLVVHRDGELESRVYKVPLALYRLGRIAGITLAVAIVVGAALYAPIARTAARVPGMTREIERLSMENRQVRQLSQTLDALQNRYDQVRAALGANVVSETEMLSDSTPVARPVFAVPAALATDYETGASLPTHWPIDSIFYPGVLTRGLVPEGGVAEAHLGIDIAVPTGTPIRAAGGGVVAEAGFDVEYGLFVLIEHVDGYRSMYGHASRVLVERGDSILAGQVIALVGSTGRSTAPHLHFEKRRGDQWVDPLAELNRES